MGQPIARQMLGPSRRSCEAAKPDARCWMPDPPTHPRISKNVEHRVSSIGRRSRPICVHLRYLRFMLDGMTHG